MSTLKPKTIEEIFIAMAFVLTIAFAGITAFAIWGNNFATSQVKSQLVQEKIFFPPKGDPGLSPKEFPTLQKYAGQQIDSGVKAKAYADEFIWVHMQKVAGGKTYAEVSALAKASPTDAKLAGQKATLFQGDMLRSSLLTAYAFSVFGQLAKYAVYGGAVVTALMFMLTLIGLMHLNSKPRSRSSKR